MANAGTAEVTEFDAPGLLSSLEGASPSQARHRLFEGITNIDSYLLDNIMLKRASVPDSSSARSIRDNLAALFEIRKADAAELLATSQSSFSRSDHVDSHMLDRTYAISNTFAKVSAVLGPSYARAWFKTPNPGLENEVPLALLNSSYGEKRVENLIEGLLHGAVV